MKPGCAVCNKRYKALAGRPEGEPLYQMPTTARGYGLASEWLHVSCFVKLKRAVERQAKHRGLAA